MVPPIYVRSSLNLGKVSLFYYNIVSILNEQYHTKDTSGLCVCVPSHVSHLKHWVWEVCVCPISLCPIYKIEGGGQKVGIVFVCVVSHLIFIWVSHLTG